MSSPSFCTSSLGALFRETISNSLSGEEGATIIPILGILEVLVRPAVQSAVLTNGLADGLRGRDAALPARRQHVRIPSRAAGRLGGAVTYPSSRAASAASLAKSGS